MHFKTITLAIRVTETRPTCAKNMSTHKRTRNIMLKPYAAKIVVMLGLFVGEWGILYCCRFPSLLNKRNKKLSHKF